MGAVRVRFECAQCGREAPSEPGQLTAWRHADLVLAGDVDEVAAAMVLCPDCDSEDRSGEYEPGGSD